MTMKSGTERGGAVRAGVARRLLWARGAGAEMGLTQGPLAAQPPRTYYSYPAMKEPHWGPEVILYFFTGGVAAGAYLVATLAHLFGGPEDRSVARAGRYLALGAIAASPLLLIADLGQPRRWRNMLRILKTRSPMSTGSWGLSGLGLFAGLAAARQAVEDGLIPRRSWLARTVARVPLEASGLLGTLAGFFVGSYTGVLLSFTNVPVWAKSRLLMGPLYLTSALSTGLAAISAALAASGPVGEGTRRWLGRASDAAGVAEAGLAAGTVASLGPQARPLTRGRYALPFWAGTLGLGLALPLLLRRNLARVPSREVRLRLAGAGASVLLGGLLVRWATVMAGRESARRPEAYLALTQGRRGN